MPLSHPSVLIAGAGPSGLVLALVLLQNGVSVRVIDKEPKHRIGSRRTAVQPRTLELYNILGVLSNIQKEGEFLPSMAKYNPGELKPASMSKIAEWVEPTPDTPHANVISISQERHEEILCNTLEKLGCTVDHGCELRPLEQFPGHVVAHITRTDAAGEQTEEHTKFDWLIGTDGVHSIVCHQLGLSFLGETRTEQHMALGDIVVEEGVSPEVFIAGDAVHCHSPTGGQGLNSCVQDVTNLGWKLALVHKDLAPEMLLDTYSEERVCVIAQMMKVTTDLYNASFDQLHRAGVAIQDALFLRGGDLNMLGVNYCGSSIISEDAAVAGNNAYSKAEGGCVQAAYRTPDMPGLIHVGSTDAPTTLFAIFRGSAHTVLLFGGVKAACAPVVDELARIPAEILQTVLVLQQGQQAAGEDSLFDAVLVDCEGHAYTGYGLQPHKLTIVMVRPDGVVGVVASDA
ncbi:monooxygenase [Mycena maculata]|uniref:Monooxygenase n=1 Tax=Mycena maculata TaxID=230809 RepID=A0AAD7NXW0_9AGAR|nr:monooxygenase [Mycena maculata]